MQTVFGALYRATNIYEQRIDERLVELGLRATELQIMRLAARPGGVAIVDVRVALGLRVSTLASAVGRLQRAGYLVKRRGGPDGRHRVIEATVPGETAARIGESILLELEASLAGTSRLERDVEILSEVADMVARLPTAEIDPVEGLPEVTA